MDGVYMYGVCGDWNVFDGLWWGCVDIRIAQSVKHWKLLISIVDVV